MHSQKLCVPPSYLHVFCSLSSFGHSLVHPSYSSPHSLPSLSLHSTPRRKIISLSTYLLHIQVQLHSNVIMPDKQSVQDNVDLYALYENHHHWVVTAQHSLFPWGQTSCDVYVTCTASWPGHAPGPHATVALIFPFTIKNLAMCMQYYNLKFITCSPYVMWFICSLISYRLFVVAVGYLKKTKKQKTVYIDFAYRISSQLNYAFVCSLLATSELAPKWSYHWISEATISRRCKSAGWQTLSGGWWAADQAGSAEPPRTLNSFAQNICNQYLYFPLNNNGWSSPGQTFVLI